MRSGWTNRHGTTRIVAIAAMTAMTAACVGGGEVRRPVRSASKSRPRPAPPAIPNDVAFRQCAANLTALAVSYQPLPNEAKGPGCALSGTIKLLDYGVPTTNLGPMTCTVATPFAAWVRNGVVPAARLYLGAEIARVETFGTYACRNVVGNPGMAGKRSEHAHANAVDISAFVLSDGRRVSVEKDWRGSGPEAQFLRRIRESACKRFKTVLSPDYNAAHYNHFHFDMGGRGGYCR